MQDLYPQIAAYASLFAAVTMFCKINLVQRLWFNLLFSAILLAERGTLKGYLRQRQGLLIKAKNFKKLTAEEAMQTMFEFESQNLTKSEWAFTNLGRTYA